MRLKYGQTEFINNNLFQYPSFLLYDFIISGMLS